MAFEIIYDHDKVIFRGSSEAAVVFLLRTEESIRMFYHVVRGETLDEYTANDYLVWMRVI